MIAISYVEIAGKTFGPGERLPKLSKTDEAWLLEGGYARAVPAPKEKPKTRQKGKADDVQRGDK